MIRFGGQFLPVHFVGALVEGIVPAGGLNVGYKAGVGNGRAAVVSRGGDAGDGNNGLSFLASVVSKPDALRPRTGGSVYSDTITSAIGGEVGAKLSLRTSPTRRRRPSSSRRSRPCGTPPGGRGRSGVTRITCRPRTGCRGPERSGSDTSGSSTSAFRPMTCISGRARARPVTLGVRYEPPLLAAIKVEYRTWSRDAGSAVITAASFRWRSRSDGLPPARHVIAVRLLWPPGLRASATARRRPATSLSSSTRASTIDNLTLADLRRLLLGDREFWTSGLRVMLLIRAPIARERDAVVRDVCQMTEAQFRQHWIAKVFRTDTPSGPKIVYSAEMALDQVSRVSGAITLVAAASVTSAVKVVRIDGLRPGEPGYPLR